MNNRCLLVAILVLVSLLATGCSYNVLVPDVDMPAQQPEIRPKVPLKAAILLPDDNLEIRKSFSVGEFSYVFTVPFGKMLKKSSRTVLPQYFEETGIVTNQKEAEQFDLILVPTVQDFFWESAVTGLSTNHLKAKVNLNLVGTDRKGTVIVEKTAFSPWITRVYTGLSGDEWGRQYGMAVIEATAAALKEAAGGLTISLAFRDYLAGAKPAAVSAVPADEPTGMERANTLPDESAKKKLKAAFESGAITIDQLNRAFDELPLPQRSKMLDAFMKGMLEEKQFGELY